LYELFKTNLFYLYLSFIDLAIETFRIAIELESELYDAYTHLANALYEKGQVYTN